MIEADRLLFIYYPGFDFAHYVLYRIKKNKVIKVDEEEETQLDTRQLIFHKQDILIPKHRMYNQIKN